MSLFSEGPADDRQIEPEPEPVRRGREAMGRPVADFADLGRPWRLDVQCAGSCWGRHRLVADLVPQLPPGLTWAEAITKLRCGQCGEDADIVGLCGPPATPGAGAVWLLLQRGKGRWRQ